MPGGPNQNPSQVALLLAQAAQNPGGAARILAGTGAAPPGPQAGNPPPFPTNNLMAALGAVQEPQAPPTLPPVAPRGGGRLDPSGLQALLQAMMVRRGEQPSLAQMLGRLR